MLRAFGLAIVRLAFSGSFLLAGWFVNRDNSQTPLPRDHPHFDAFVTVGTSHGVSQGVQVCPNVFLTTGHGIDDELNAGLALAGSWIKIIRYPFSAVSFFDLTDDNHELTTDYLDRFGRPRPQRD